MKYIFAILVVIFGSIAFPGAAAAACTSQSKGYGVDGAHSTPGNGYTVRIMYGSGRNCLGDGTNQGKILLKLADTSVDGYTFCTNAVHFRDQVTFFDDDSAWRAANQGHPVMGILVFGYNSDMAPSALDNPEAGITMRNRTGGDDLWDMEVATGYYQVTDPSMEATAHDDCVAQTKHYVLTI